MSIIFIKPGPTATKPNYMYLLNLIPEKKCPGLLNRPIKLLEQTNKVTFHEIIKQLKVNIPRKINKYPTGYDF